MEIYMDILKLFSMYSQPKFPYHIQGSNIENYYYYYYYF